MGLYGNNFQAPRAQQADPFASIGAGATPAVG